MYKTILVYTIISELVIVTKVKTSSDKDEAKRLLYMLKEVYLKNKDYDVHELALYKVKPVITFK